MSLENIMNIAGMAMDAQTVRLNLSVSNIANAETIASSPEEAFKAKRPVFITVLEKGKIGEIYNIGCDEGMEYSIVYVA